MEELASGCRRAGAAAPAAPLKSWPDSVELPDALGESAQHPGQAIGPRIVIYFVMLRHSNLEGGAPPSVKFMCLLSINLIMGTRSPGKAAGLHQMVQPRYIFGEVSMLIPVKGRSMSKKKGQPETEDVAFAQARDELFSHVLRCGVIDALPEHQKDWFDDTMLYLADRYDTLSEEELAQLRTLGERFCQPVQRKNETAGTIS